MSALRLELDWLSLAFVFPLGLRGYICKSINKYSERHSVRGLLQLEGGVEGPAGLGGSGLLWTQLSGNWQVARVLTSNTK